jgi:hypothetical protein
MQFVFGPGNMVATPLSDSYGNVIALPTPRLLGGFQEAAFSSSADTKMLYGPNQYPIAVGRGKGKTDLKVKAAQVSVDKWNAMYIGQPLNQTAGVLAAYIDTLGTVIPTTPFQITPVTTYAAYLEGTTPVFSYDLGVQDGNGNAYVQHATPTTGQYSLAAGVYTFAAADAGKTVFISFVYTATNAAGGKNVYLNVSNVQMGQAPTVQIDLQAAYGTGGQVLVTMFQAIATKIDIATKLDDFAVPNMEFDGFANAANVIYRIAASQ